MSGHRQFIRSTMAEAHHATPAGHFEASMIPVPARRLYVFRISPGCQRRTPGGRRRRPATFPGGMRYGSRINNGECHRPGSLSDPGLPFSDAPAGFHRTGTPDRTKHSRCASFSNSSRPSLPLETGEEGYSRPARRGAAGAGAALFTRRPRRHRVTARIRVYLPLTVLGGEPAVPCYPQSATAGPNPHRRSFGAGFRSSGKRC